MPRKTHPDTAGLDEYGLPPVLHTEVLCYLSGVKSTRLHQLIKDGRIPAECNLSGDKWRATLTLREMFGYYRRQADQRRPSGERAIELQTTMEELRTKRLKNAKMARELLPRHVYVQVWGELLSAFKNRWLEFPHKMGPRAFRAKDKADAAEILEKEVEDIFRVLQDPKFMEDIAAKILDDELDQPADPDRPTGDSAGDAEDLVPADA